MALGFGHAVTKFCGNDARVGNTRFYSPVRVLCTAPCMGNRDGYHHIGAEQNASFRRSRYLDQWIRGGDQRQWRLFDFSAGRNLHCHGSEPRSELHNCVAGVGEHCGHQRGDSNSGFLDVR